MEYVNELLKFLGQATILIAVVTFLLKSYFKNLVAHFFKKELEEYKHDLNLITEEKKFDYQRKLHDFNLYRSRRHESYRVLFKLALSSLNKINHSRKETVWPKFEDMTYEEIEVYLKTEIKDEFEVQKTNRRFQQYRDFSIIKSSIVATRLKETMLEINKFIDYFEENELYYSNDVISVTLPMKPKMNEVSKIISVQVLVKQMVDIEIEEGFFKEKIDSLDGEIQFIEECVGKLKKQIVNELSIGDYS
ncbi:hypothetical protein DFO73_11632 [Cytobacillus oceanisediminis]|uniref:Uncharacterized protein n=1 Tax=Cytobacillus oceanisediminis TaxID=665099 RepID=A0A2V2ZJZ1_9BACI|nr:hypothetical protein [Cytobacillus oceanisediminis]PWW20218.1 hypothetical protein DFO73_11632 [Cytobacillus oceanisediminis]